MQILRCSLWGLGGKNRPEPPHIFGGNGHLVGLTRTHARSKYGSIVSDLKPLYRDPKVIVVRARWCIRGSGLTKQQAPAGPKRHTAVDSFGLVLWWSQQQVFLNVKRANRFSLSVYQMGQRVPRLYLIGVDRGDSGDRFLKSVMDSLGWIIQVVLPPQQIQGFVLRKKRSVVEQSLSWLN